MRRDIVVAIFVLSAPALAQSSASYELTEAVLNAGGRPAQGTRAASPSYHLSLEAIGEGAAGNDLTGASFRVGPGFVPAHPPPGEVAGLGFADRQLLTWSPEKSAGSYDLYRDALTTLPGGFGTCFAPRLMTTAAVDADPPAPSAGFFYLVTVRSRLDEEGTKGSTSNGVRSNPSPCP